MILAAVNNLYPVVLRRAWLVTLGFGLIHGFGFATVLEEVGLPREQLLVALLGFNVGVELGQLAIIAAALPLLLVLSASRVYVPVVLHGGSVAVMIMGLVWLADRVSPQGLAAGAPPERSKLVVAGALPPLEPLDLEGWGEVAAQLERSRRALEAGERQEADRAHEAVLERLEGDPNPRAAARLARRISLEHARDARWPEALLFREAARRLHDAVGDEGEAAADRAYLGRLHEAWGRPRAARSLLASALETFIQLEDRFAQADLHRDLARLARGQGDLAAAGRHLRRSRALDVALDQVREVEEDEGALADIYERTGELELASKSFRSALHRAEVRGDSEAAGMYAARLGHIEAARGSMNEAEAFYERALRYLEPRADGEILADVWVGLGRLDAAAGRPELARARFARGAEVYEAAGRAEKASRARLLSTRLDLPPSCSSSER